MFIRGEPHNVPVGRNLRVNIGDEIEIGRSISDGKIQPQDLIKLRGVRDTQDYLVDALQSEYGSQGIRVKRKILETVIKPLTSSVRILDPGNHPTHIPGDHALANLVDKWNEGKSDTQKMTYEPLLRGINTAPLKSEDWLSRLNFQRLTETLMEGPAQGWKSDISSVEAPLAAFAYGAEFGKWQ